MNARRGETEECPELSVYRRSAARDSSRQRMPLLVDDVLLFLARWGWRRVRFHSCLEQRDVFLFFLVLSLFEISSRSREEGRAIVFLFYMDDILVFAFLVVVVVVVAQREGENGKNCNSLLFVPYRTRPSWG